MGSPSNKDKILEDVSNENEIISPKSPKRRNNKKKLHRRTTEELMHDVLSVPVRKSLIYKSRQSELYNRDSKLLPVFNLGKFESTSEIVENCKGESTSNSNESDGESDDSGNFSLTSSKINILIHTPN